MRVALGAGETESVQAAAARLRKEVEELRRMLPTPSSAPPNESSADTARHEARSALLEALQLLPNSYPAAGRIADAIDGFVAAHLR